MTRSGAARTRHVRGEFKAEAGYACRLPISGPFDIALGRTVAAYAVPRSIEAVYDTPVSWTLFAKIALGL